MKLLAATIASMDSTRISELQSAGELELKLSDGSSFHITEADVEISAADVPGWQMAMHGKLTVALDIQLNDALIREGNARELINRIQNLRKNNNYELTDRIRVILQPQPFITEAVESFNDYICTEILADSLELLENKHFKDSIEVNDQRIGIEISKSTINN
jgi:isoleucyl-tRNA synthetase